MVVNGITAWQMLHRRPASAPGRRSWCSAPTAASARSWSSSPAHAGLDGDRHGVRAPPRRPARARRRPRSTTAPRTSPRGSANSPPTAWTPSSTTSAAAASSTRGGCSRPAARSSPTAAPSTQDDAATRSARCSSCSAGWLFGTCCPTAARAYFFNLWAGARSGRPVPRGSCARTSRVLELLAAGRDRRRRSPRAFALEHAADGAALRRGRRRHREGPAHTLNACTGAHCRRRVRSRSTSPPRPHASGWR